MTNQKQNTMETYKTSNRPEVKTKFKLFVYPSAAQARNGWNMENSKTYYEVDTFLKTIVLKFECIYDDNAEVIRFNQYSKHYGGEFCVTEEQNKKFEKAYKRVQKLAYETI